MECEKGKEGPHYWIIDELNLGICKNCGDTKQFPIKIDTWSGYTPKGLIKKKKGNK